MPGVVHFDPRWCIVELPRRQGVVTTERTNKAPAGSDQIDAFRLTPINEQEAGISRIGEFFAIARSRWKTLLAGGVTATAVAMLALLVLPRAYVATAYVLPMPSAFEVQFEPKIRTVDQAAQSGTTTGTSASVTPERRQALADLVGSSELESQVLQNLRGKISLADAQPGSLATHVKGTLMPKSDMIAIQADAASAQDAIAIANEWVAAYALRVNRIYSGSSGTQTLDSLVHQRDDALTQLQSVQAALVSDISTSSLESLDSRIKNDEHQLSLLQSAYQAGVFPQGTEASFALDDYRLSELRTINDLAQTLRRLNATRESARALLNQANNGPGQPNDAAALALMKAQLVSLSGALPSQLQFQIPASGDADSANDLRSLIAGIDQARSAVQQEFATRRQAYETKRQSDIAALQDELRDLRSQFEARLAQRKELTGRRDLMLDTYSALARKVEERRVAEAGVGQAVQIASYAGAAQSTTPKPSIVIPVAAIIGVALAAGVIFATSTYSARPRLTATESPRVAGRPA